MSFTPPVRSIAGPSFARTATSALPSTSRVTKKCGTVVQLCVVRSAIRRPIELSDSPRVAETPSAGRAAAAAGAETGGAGAAGAALALFAAACTSSATISPSGPDPRRRLTSTPSSFASRRAFGEIGAGPDEATSGAGAGAAVAVGGALSIVRPVCVGAVGGRRLLARLKQPADGLPDRHDVADLRGDAAENPGGLRLDLDDRLVGLDLEEHLALGDLVALVLLPGHQLAGLLGHFEGGHHDAHGHRSAFSRR